MCFDMPIIINAELTARALMNYLFPNIQSVSLSKHRRSAFPTPAYDS